jgi:phosphoglycerate dehydrogenase-like enzyme
LFCDIAHYHQTVYGDNRLAQLGETVSLYPEVITSENFDQHAKALEGLEVIFSTWGMPNINDKQLQCLPRLEAIFYSAGSVQNFARPYLDRNIQVFSAWAANAIPVAEFSMAQIILSCKRYFQNSRDCKNSELRFGPNLPRGPGAYNERIALIGAGMIGRKVVELLKPFHLEVVVVDPFLSDDEARCMGVIKVSMEEAFETAYVISNHLPNIPSTVGLLNGRLFSLMRQGATFINTGRGAQVVEGEMLKVLKERTDLSALLDVTLPEPPEKNSEFYTLPNIFLSSHIAGSLGNEVVRMADFMIDEFKRWLNGDKLRYSVSIKMLETMA